jgi:tagaturonate reductase
MMTMKKLNKTTVTTPKRPIKILQFGSGNFLRGFADWMIELMNEHSNFNGSVVIIQSHSPSIPKAFLEQDNLYHVLIQGFEKGKVINSNKLITCIDTIINPKLDYDSFLEQAENPALEFIISNTTEAGIHFDPLDVPQNGQVPITFPGMLTALLFRRFQLFGGDKSKSLIIIPCELIENNGSELKSVVLKYTMLWAYPETFKNWLEESVAFCNSLVDRIVPGFPKNDLQEIQQKLGYKDNLVVVAEPFHLWAIEGSEKIAEKFPTAQADLQVQFVPNLHAYRTRKVRILNGAHTAMVPLGLLRGIETVKEAIDDAEVGPLIHKLIFEEILPVLDSPQKELEEFAADILDRFRNPFIRHELSAIALNSISKFNVRVLPSILDNYKKSGKWSPVLIHSFAALLVFYKGSYKGKATPLKDDTKILAFFKSEWEKRQSLKSLVTALLSNENLWDQDLSKYEGLVLAIEKQVEKYLD